MSLQLFEFIIKLSWLIDVIDAIIVYRPTKNLIDAKLAIEKELQDLRKEAVK